MRVARALPQPTRRAFSAGDNPGSRRDLVVHKAFAGRDKDWGDIRAIVVRQPSLDYELIRLTTLLAEHPRGAVPETFALLALMHLHGARLVGRIDGAGGLLLLEEQDRGLWDQQEMRVGVEWLARSASGDQFSRYHAEAGIAAEHCFAPSFHETRWQEIAGLYARLEQVSPSPLHTLNRAVAVAEWQGVDAALTLLDGMALPAWLERSYLWDAVLGDLYRRAGRIDEFERHRSLAVSAAPSEAVRRLLERRLSS